MIQEIKRKKRIESEINWKGPHYFESQAEIDAEIKFLEENDFEDEIEENNEQKIDDKNKSKLDSKMIRN